MEERAEQELGTVDKLIETCKNGEYGFQTAAEGVRDAQLKVLFQRYAAQRAEFARELQGEARRLSDKKPEDSGTPVGALHRAWINLKAEVTNKDEKGIVAECERGEDEAKREYEKALERTLSPAVHELIQRQYVEVKAAHDHIRALEIAAVNTS